MFMPGFSLCVGNISKLTISKITFDCKKMFKQTSTNLPVFKVDNFFGVGDIFRLTKIV